MQINAAVALLKAGELVAFPTETVYGLGADARNLHAVEKIFALKNRPSDHPIIVHLIEPVDWQGWASDITESAKKLAAHFWPGPLTLVVKRNITVLDVVTGGQDSVGLRVPSHPLAQELLKQFGGAIAAPSANRFGHVSPTTAAHVRDEFGDITPFILDGDTCTLGIESTILDCRSEVPVLLRPGSILVAEIEALLGYAISRPDAQSLQVSGSLPQHYAPDTPLALATWPAINIALENAKREKKSIGVLSFREAPFANWYQVEMNPVEYAHELYSILRYFDAQKLDQILIETPPQTPAWEAVNDRLKKAVH